MGGQWHSDTSPLVFPGESIRDEAGADKPACYIKVLITAKKKFYKACPRYYSSHSIFVHFFLKILLIPESAILLIPTTVWKTNERPSLRLHRNKLQRMHCMTVQLFATAVSYNRKSAYNFCHCGLILH
jgi:hypothetical protein